MLRYCYDQKFNKTRKIAEDKTLLNVLIVLKNKINQSSTLILLHHNHKTSRNSKLSFSDRT